MQPAALLDFVLLLTPITKKPSHISLLTAPVATQQNFSYIVLVGDNKNLRVLPWGGRGKGGRGTSRRTFQPDDIIVDAITLEYVNDAKLTGSGSGGSKLLLSEAYLKLLPGKVYALVGR